MAWDAVSRWQVATTVLPDFRRKVFIQHKVSALRKMVFHVLGESSIDFQTKTTEVFLVFCTSQGVAAHSKLSPLVSHSSLFTSIPFSA